MNKLPEIKEVREAYITDKKLFMIVSNLKDYNNSTYFEPMDSIIAFDESCEKLEVHLYLDVKINHIIDEMDVEDSDFDLRDLEYVKSVLAEVEDKGFDFFIIRKD